MIVRRKFALPELGRQHLKRDRLLQALGTGVAPENRLTLVLGAPGTGKTTLAAEYAATFELGPVAWYGLGPGERDPIVFFEHLSGCLRQAVPDFPEQPLALLRTFGNGGLANASAMLCDALDQALGGACLLVVLDDIGHLGDRPEATETLEALAAYFPASAQLLITGRTLPSARLAQYDLRGQIVRIGDEALAFTVPEIAALLALSGEVAPGATEAVAARTHGWAAGVGYAVGSGGAPERLEAPGPLHAYLREEVFGALEADFLDKLFAISFLDAVDEPTCNRLFGPAARGFLADLSRHRTFVQLAGTTLALQPILRDVLQLHVLDRWPASEQTDLFRRLALAAENRVEAIGFRLLAQDWEVAETLLGGASQDLIEAGHLATIRTLVERFDPLWLKQSVWLQYALGELTWREADLVSSLRHLAEAEGLARDLGSDTHLGVIWACRAVVHGVRGEGDAQCDYATRALAALSLDAGRPRATSLNVLGTYHLYRGEVPEAQAHFGEAMRVYRDLGDLRGQTRIQHNLGLAEARKGRFKEAASHYHEALRLAGESGLAPYPITFNNLALSRIYTGDFPAAWQAVEEGMALAERAGSRRDKAILQRTVARLHLETGRHEQAREILAGTLEAASLTGDRMSHRLSLLALAEVALADREPSEAAARLAEAMASGGVTLGEPGSEEMTLVHCAIEIASGRPGDAHAFLSALHETVTEDRNALLAYQTEILSSRVAQAAGDDAERGRLQDRAARLAGKYGFKPTAFVGAPAAQALRLETGSSSPGHQASSSAAAGRDRGGSENALDVRCLGGFDVTVEGRRVPHRDWKISRARLAFVYLLLHPDGVTREQLTELLYPIEDPARTAVNVAISRIRYTLDPDAPRSAPSRFVIFLGGGNYGFNQGLQARVDVLEFRRALAAAVRMEKDPRGARQHLEEAVSCYGGRFMPEFEESLWCQIERESLRRALDDAYSRLFAIVGAVDDWEALLRHADGWLAHDPASEAAHCARILALAMQERPDEALRAGVFAAKTLGSLGLPGPGDRTVEILDLIRDGHLGVRHVRQALARD